MCSAANQQCAVLQSAMFALCCAAISNVCIVLCLAAAHSLAVRLFLYVCCVQVFFIHFVYCYSLSLASVKRECMAWKLRHVE